MLHLGSWKKRVGKDILKVEKLLNWMSYVLSKSWFYLWFLSISLNISSKLIQITCNSFLNYSDSPRSRSYQSNRKVNQGNGLSESRSSSTTAHSKGGNSFKEFLWQHIEMALGRGFDDNVGRNPVPSLFEVCLWSKESLE